MKTFKYETHLSTISNCPPSAHTALNKIAFRWVHRASINKSFDPVLIINPARKLDSSDATCSGYALSMFDTETNAYSKYKILTTKNRKLIKTLGNEIAAIQLVADDGVGGLPDTRNYGHFDFYEYDGIDLSEKIITTTQIFDADGNFRT